MENDVLFTFRKMFLKNHTNKTQNIWNKITFYEHHQDVFISLYFYLYFLSLIVCESGSALPRQSKRK